MKGPGSHGHFFPRLCAKGDRKTSQGPGPSINDRGPGIYSQKQKVGLSTVGGGKVATHAHRIEINLAVICYFFLSRQAAFTCFFGELVLFWGNTRLLSRQCHDTTLGRFHY